MSEKTGAKVSLRAASALREAARRIKKLPLMTITASLIVLLVFFICGWLWHFSELRPYLATAGAAVAAFAGPLPALLTPELRGKWLFAVGISALITVGVWFATKDLQDQLQRTAAERAQLSERLDDLSGSIGSLVRQQPDEQRSSLLLAAGQHERNLYRERRFWLILDSARTILEIDPDNGHGLYYAGEAYRHFHEWNDMRDMFQKFIAAADANPDSQTGVAKDCYARPNGFCMERLAYINHLMALDSLAAADAATGAMRIDALHAAFRFERDDLARRPAGFLADGKILSSCEVLRRVSAELKAANADNSEVDVFLKTKKGGCSGQP